MTPITALDTYTIKNLESFSIERLARFIALEVERFAAQKVFIVMIGVQCAGKSFLSEYLNEKFGESVLIRPDDIRYALSSVEEYDNTLDRVVFKQVYRQMEEFIHCKDKSLLIYDAQNIFREWRYRCLNIAYKHKIAVIGVFLNVPYELVLERWKTRTRNIPGKTWIEYCYQSVEFPRHNEGFDTILSLDYIKNQIDLSYKSGQEPQ